MPGSATKQSTSFAPPRPFAVTVFEAVLYNIPDSSSSACSIKAALTTTSRRGTRKTMVEAQAID
jgi:hypothetical protein